MNIPRRTEAEQLALNERIKNTITPNKLRILKRGLRDARAEYSRCRAKALAAGRAMRAEPKCGRLLLDYEHAIGEAVMARHDVKHMTGIIAARTPYVQTGSKWSERGLANVRCANANR